MLFLFLISYTVILRFFLSVVYLEIVYVQKKVYYVSFNRLNNFTLLVFMK